MTTSDKAIEVSLIESYHSILSIIHSIERKCYATQTITEPQFRKLTTNIEELNFYSKYLVDICNIEVIAKPLPLPSQLNDFTRPAYLASLKEKYETSERNKQTRILSYC